MPRKVLLVALIALVQAPAATARPVQLMPGVMHDHRLQWTAAGPVSMHVVTTPRPVGLYSLTPLLSNGTVTGRETVSSMQRRVSRQMTTVGVNGDFFDWSGGWPTGLLLRGGVLEHHPAQNRSAVGVDATGTLHVDKVPFVSSWRGPSQVEFPLDQLNEPPRPNAAALFTPAWGAATPRLKATAVVLERFPPTTSFSELSGDVTRIVTDSSVAIPPGGAVLVGRGRAAAALRSEVAVDGGLTVRLGLRQDWAQVTDAVGGGPALVRDGVPIADAGESLTHLQLLGRDPRTAIGQRPDGGLVFVAVDGRRHGWSIGITRWDLALALIRYGCVTGFALDAGGSTTVAFDGRVLNRPSDDSGERAVAEALVVGYTGVYAPSPAPTLSPNGDGLGDTETLSYKVVRPSTISAKLSAPDGTMRELAAGAKQPGTYRVTWNGLAAAGAPAPEGPYGWTVSATDDLGRSSTAKRRFSVDGTLGFPRLHRNARRIAFKLTRPAAIRVTIEDRYGQIFRTLAAGPRPAGNHEVRWNGRDGRRRLLRGAYVVRLAATSEVGLSELRLPVTIRR